MDVSVKTPVIKFYVHAELAELGTIKRTYKELSLSKYNANVNDAWSSFFRITFKQRYLTTLLITVC